MSEKRPFAYAVVKNAGTRRITPTLASAVVTAAEVCPNPSEVLEIIAWFGDGTSYNLPFESLATTDRLAWISADEARRLEKSLFAPEADEVNVRQQVARLIRRNDGCDYWEKLVLRYAEVLLANVEEHLRGIPIEEASLETWRAEDWENLPDTIELVDGLPSPKTWNINIERRRRLRWTDSSEEFSFFRGKTSEEIEAEYARRRAELRARPYVPSAIPFPSGRED